MPQYLSPGVYVEEVAPKSLSISGVGTSTAGFIGLVPEGIKMPAQPGKFQTDDTGKIRLFKVDATGNIALFELGVDGNPDPTKPTTDPAGKPIEDPNGKPISISYDLAPANDPKLITSWEEFKSKFGDFQTGNKTLAHAVVLSCG
jgi:uncharacterized protein